MKNAVYYKDLWLMPGSKALELFREWKKQTDSKLQQVNRKKLDDHLKLVNKTYNETSGISI